jgi:hypothetical protein
MYDSVYYNTSQELDTNKRARLSSLRDKNRKK